MSCRHEKAHKHLNKNSTDLCLFTAGTEPTSSTKKKTEGPTGRTTKEGTCQPLETTVTPTTLPLDNRIPIQCDVAIVGGGTFSYKTSCIIKEKDV